MCENIREKHIANGVYYEIGAASQLCSGLGQDLFRRHGRLVIVGNEKVWIEILGARCDGINVEILDALRQQNVFIDRKVATEREQSECTLKNHKQYVKALLSWARIAYAASAMISGLRILEPLSIPAKNDDVTGK